MRLLYQLDYTILINFSRQFLFDFKVLKYFLSTSSLIRPSYPLSATIFKKVFFPQNFPVWHEVDKRIYTIHLYGVNNVSFFAAFECSLLEFNALFANPHASRALNSRQEQWNAAKKEKLLSLQMSGVIFHCLVRIHAIYL